MKLLRNNTILLFFFITIVNLFIFLYRDHFLYHEYCDYASLYASDTAKWRAFVDDFPKQELVEAKKIVDSSVRRGGISSTAKIVAIGKFLYSRFYRQTGVPSARIAQASPLQQYKLFSSSDSEKLWCGNFASMFAYFCWAEGIPCRILEIMNPGDHHVVNECYLPDSNNWVMTDVTTNHFLIWDADRNRYENLLHLRDSSATSLFSWQDVDDSVVRRPFQRAVYAPYFGNKNPINCYYRINNLAVYKPAEKIRRYFLPVAWYQEVDNSPGRNLPFYIKQFFTLLWLICLVALIRQIFRRPKSFN